MTAGLRQYPQSPRINPIFAEVMKGRLAASVDPLQRLLDPNFTETLWEYEHSRVEPIIPGQLHPKQVAALSSNAKHRWLFWGNQVGKTTLGAVEVVLLALGRHPFHQTWDAPITAWASALTWELWEKILLPELLTWIPKDRIIDAPEPYKHSTKRDILVRADNGKISRITGKAAEQGADKYQSARVHIVWLDEEHPEAVWNEMQPRLVRHGGITIATMTPLKGMTWVIHRVYQPYQKGTLSKDAHFVSHAGLSDNPSITPEALQGMIAQFAHSPSQLAARLEGKIVRPQGLAFQIEPANHFASPSHAQIMEWTQKGRGIAAIDFGHWRFAFLFGVEDHLGNMHLVQEVFSQRESLEQRAKKVHDILAAYAAPPELVIAGDCANPTDIVELNLAFERIGSPYRVAGVQAEHKSRTNGVDRIQSLFHRRSLWIRRGMGETQVWRLGMNASREGEPIGGSRFLWELDNWAFPKPNITHEPKAQKQDPDDNTADGADMMAALRYLVLTWWAKGESKRPPSDHENRDAGIDWDQRRLRDWSRDDATHRDQPTTGVPSYAPPGQTFAMPFGNPRAWRSNRSSE